jgi:translation elongation factor EF-Tu-like GTPase
MITMKVDLTGKAKGDIIRIDSIIMPKGVTPSEKVDKDNYVLAKIESGRSK